MSTPLNFKTHGGPHGTHSGSKSGNARQRRNPSDYGPFSSPHGSFDDPVPFPPYAELPFTSLKRRRQLQDNNSFVKWVMRSVLLSPLVVLVLWSVAAVMFANNHHVGHSNNSNKSNNYSSSSRRQRSNRNPPNYYGNGPNTVVMAGIPQQQQQLQAPTGNNMIYNVNGNAMMMAPPQAQQQLQVMSQGQPAANTILMTNGYQQVQQGGTIQMQAQGNPIPVMTPLGNGMASNDIPSNNLQQGQQQVYQQVLPQAGAAISNQSHQTFMATNDANALQQASGMTQQQQQQQQQIPQTNLASPATNAMNQPSMTDSGASGQLLQLSSTDTKVAQASAAMQQGSTQSGATQADQLQAAPAKQAIYFYDPKETKMSQTGEIIEMPTLVYDGNGKAVPLEEIRHVAPVYVQAPARGATDASSSTTTETNELVAPTARGASLVAPTSKEASLSIPQSWGTSTSQDQTIIVATVAVMALLVGALSARRLRSKSFLSACIENESLEDDVAYDDAYTTTASGAMGADSSYNTFGGWKGDLEKFDV